MLGIIEGLCEKVFSGGVSRKHLRGLKCKKTSLCSRSVRVSMLSHCAHLYPRSELGRDGVGVREYLGATTGSLHQATRSLI